jgi:hypothetical protein
LLRENARNLQHPETDLCTLERDELPNPFSGTMLSLELCTLLRRYGFEPAFEMGAFEASSDVEFEINSLDRGLDNSSG